MRRLTDFRFASAACCAVAALAISSAARAACHADSYELPVKMVGSRAVATVQINGTSVPLTIDSGAPFSILTEAAASQLQLRLSPNANVRMNGLAGPMLGRTTTVDKLVLMKGEFERVQFVVGGNEPGAGTMGLIGRNILSAGDTEYDLAHGMIRFLFPNRDCAAFGMAYWAGKTPVTEIDLIEDARDKAPSIRAKVGVNGKEFTALFDTGAPTLLSATMARRAGIAETDWKSAGFTYGLGSGRIDQWTVPFARFQIGGEGVVNGHLRVADFDLGEADMLLGVDFFLSHRIYVSRQQSKIFMTYAGGPVFALDQVVKAEPGTGDAGAGSETLSVDELARRGAASVARRDYEGALADLDRACQLEPGSAALFAQRAGIQVILKHPDRALEDLDRALALDAALNDARLQRASLRLGAKDREGAKADLDALAGALPAQAQMRRAMADLYMTLGQPAQAIAELDQWLPAHPKEFRREVALNTRCWARMLLGIELDRALDDCDEAVDADAKSAAFLDSRGWVRLRRGEDRKALADFERSVAMQPKLASALYGRGAAKIRLGDRAEGDADLEAARALQPDIERRMARLATTVAGP